MLNGSVSIPFKRDMLSEQETEEEKEETVQEVSIPFKRDMLSEQLGFVAKD